jgi:hypothetical protein
MERLTSSSSVTAEFIALVIALTASFIVARAAVKVLFRGAVARAMSWTAPKKPTCLDIFVSEVGYEVGNWRFARFTLIGLLLPIFFLLVYTFAQSVASSLGA